MATHTSCMVNTKGHHTSYIIINVFLLYFQITLLSTTDINDLCTDTAIWRKVFPEQSSNSNMLHDAICVSSTFNATTYVEEVISSLDGLEEYIDKVVYRKVNESLLFCHCNLPILHIVTVNIISFFSIQISSSQYTMSQDATHSLSEMIANMERYFSLLEAVAAHPPTFDLGVNPEWANYDGLDDVLSKLISTFTNMTNVEDDKTKYVFDGHFKM